MFCVVLWIGWAREFTMADYETGYQALNTYSDDPDEHDDTPPTENLVQHPDQNKGKVVVITIMLFDRSLCLAKLPNSIHGSDRQSMLFSAIQLIVLRSHFIRRLDS